MRTVVRRVALVLIGCAFSAATALGQDPAYLHCPISIGSSPSRVVAADLNGDMFPDFATAEPGESNIRIVITDPSAFAAGACQGITSSSVGTQGRSVIDLAVVDLDGDRDSDIVVAEDRGARVLVNDGAGGFVVRNHIDLGIDPTTIVAGDFDLQLPADAAVGADDGSIVVLFGLQSTGLPSASVRLPPAVSVVDILKTADLSNDGRADLLVLSQEPPAYRVLLSDGDSFSSLQTVNLGQTPTDVAIDKFDADNIRDLAVTFTDDRLVVFFGGISEDGTNVTYSQGPSVTTGDSPAAVAAGLLDNDLFVDAVVANEASNTVTILINDGEGNLEESNNFCTDGGECGVGNEPKAVTLALLDSDIQRDIVVGTSEGLSFLFSSNPPPTPTPTNTPTPTATPPPSPTGTAAPTSTPTVTPTATPTPSITRTVTATRTNTTVPTRTCEPGICVQGDSCATITTGSDASSSSPLMPLLIAGFFAALRRRSRAGRASRK